MLDKFLEEWYTIIKRGIMENKSKKSSLNKTMEITIPYTIRYWKEDDWYIGQVIEKHSVISQGKTLKELKNNIFDAFKMICDAEKENLAIA